MKEFWDDRYGQPDYVYGEEPNVFLVSQLPQFTPGKILFPAEGEGRNSVYAATLGWSVTAFDQSVEGQKKAFQLAQKQGVEIAYQVGEFKEMDFPAESFDAIALIYAHFPGDLKAGYHRILASWLRKGGIVIFEAFSKNHIAYKEANPKVGGPGDLLPLFSMEEIREYFNDFEISLKHNCLLFISEFYRELKIEKGNFRLKSKTCG